MIRPPLAALGLLAALHATPGMAASMTGSTASIAVAGAGLTATPLLAVIGSGVEFHTAIGIPFLDIDIGAETVTYTALSSIRLGLVRSITLGGLAFTPAVAGISGIDVVVGGGITGIGARNFSFTGDTLRFDVTTATFLEGASIVVGLATAPNPAAVPEPGSLGLLLAGLLGLGAMSRPRAGGISWKP